MVAGEQSGSEPRKYETIKALPEGYVEIPNGCKPCLRCVDDRRPNKGGCSSDKLLGGEEYLGPQALGGSLGILVLAACAIVNDGRSLTLDEIYAIAEKIHNDLGVSWGVHADENNLDDEKLANFLKLIESSAQIDPKNSDAIIQGCGFAGMLTDAGNPLGLPKQVSDFFVEHPNIVAWMVVRGAKLAVLSGAHAQLGEVDFNVNRTPNTTYGNNCKPAYSTDLWFIEEVAEALSPDKHNPLHDIYWRMIEETSHKLAGQKPRDTSQNGSVE
jgi:hypothetical protein